MGHYRLPELDFVNSDQSGRGNAAAHSWPGVGPGDRIGRPA